MVLRPVHLWKIKYKLTRFWRTVVIRWIRKFLIRKLMVLN